MKNKHASALAKKRWEKTTPEERKEHSKKMHEGRWGKGKNKPKKLSTDDA